MLSILLTLIYTVHSTSHKARKEQFSRITKYELLNLHPIDTSNPDIKTLEFDIYNQHYSIQLERNHDMNPSYTKHYNIDPTTHKHQYITTLKQSCHFHGSVTNTDSKSRISISLCPNRGIRGEIEAFNQTLIIQPSAYYLDFTKDSIGHNINDQVLMYKLSDFNSTDQTIINGHIIDQNKKAIFKYKNDRRRLAYTAGSPAKVEEMIITGPVRINNYKSAHNDRWYQELYAAYLDMINTIDGIYKDTNWGADSIGQTNSVSVVFSGMHVIFDFTDDYSSLSPDKLYSNCQLGSRQYDDSDDCAINGNAWLGKIKTWISNFMDFSNFDNVQFVSDMKFKWEGNGWSKSRTLGWGYIGTVCTSSSVTDVSIVADMGGETNGIRTMAHELGHNFGLRHDGQSGPAADCAADDGLMGYSDGTGFSRCSIRSMKEYFNGDGGGLTCLGRGYPRDFQSNHDDGQTSSPTKKPTTQPTSKPTQRPTNNPTQTGQTDAPTQKPTTIPTTSPTAPTPQPSKAPTPPPVETSCVKISGVATGLYDGTYNELDITYNDAAVYQLVSGQQYYVYKPDSNYDWDGVKPSWVWGSSVGSGTISMYCVESSILDCSGKFFRYTQNGWVYYPDSIINTECGVAESCPGYSCVGIAGINGNYNGQFEPAGCYNGWKYYTKTNNNAAILCFNENYGRWIVTRDLCSPWSGTIVAVSGNTNTDVTGNGWFVATDSSSLSYTSGVMINDCGGGGALNIGDLDCLTDNNYDDSLCLISNNTIWTGERTFELYDQLCKNDAPIYHFTLRNTSDNQFVIDDESLNDENQIVYYLHFHREKRFVDSNETIGQWLISKNEISVNSIAVCEQDNLLDCTANNWKVESAEYGDFVLDQNDGLILRITDKHMSVSNGGCENKEFDKSEDNNNEIIIIIVVIVLLIVCGVTIYFVWKKMSVSESNKIKQSLGKHTQTATDKPMQDEMEQEIEVEVSMERNITQTQD